MKKTLIALTCGLMLAMTATKSEAIALTIDDDRFLGTVDPGNGSPETQAALINDLLSISAAQAETTVNIGGILFRRDATALCGFSGACPDASAALGMAQGGANDTTVELGTGYTYLKAKYGNTMVVWYVAGLSGDHTIPLSCGAGGGATCDVIGSGGGLSHWIAYNPSTTTVPDGGATLGLFGLGMLALGYLRRRKQ